MATTATILKTDFWPLLLNHWVIWFETYIVATEWLIDQKVIKFCWSEIQDGCHSCHLENQFFELSCRPLSWKLHCGNRMTSRSKIAKIVPIRSPISPPQLPSCFWMTSSLKTLEQFSADFGFLSKEYWQYVRMVPHNWTRWLPCPYMVKIFSRTKIVLRLKLGIHV